MSETSYHLYVIESDGIEKRRIDQVPANFNPAEIIILDEWKYSSETLKASGTLYVNQAADKKLLLAALAKRAVTYFPNPDDFSFETIEEALKYFSRMGITVEMVNNEKLVSLFQTALRKLLPTTNIQ